MSHPHATGNKGRGHLAQCSKVNIWVFYLRDDRYPALQTHCRAVAHVSWWIPETSWNLDASGAWRPPKHDKPMGYLLDIRDIWDISGVRITYWIFLWYSCTQYFSISIGIMSSLPYSIHVQGLPILQLTHMLQSISSMLWTKGWRYLQCYDSQRARHVFSSRNSIRYLRKILRTIEIVENGNHPVYWRWNFQGLGGYCEALVHPPSQIFRDTHS